MTIRTAIAVGYSLICALGALITIAKAGEPRTPYAKGGELILILILSCAVSSPVLWALWTA